MITWLCACPGFHVFNTGLNINEHCDLLTFDLFISGPALQPDRDYFSSAALNNDLVGQIHKLLINSIFIHPVAKFTIAH
jgi:hypothetical protein